MSKREVRAAGLAPQTHTHYYMARIRRTEQPRLHRVKCSLGPKLQPALDPAAKSFWQEPSIQTTWNKLFFFSNTFANTSMLDFACVCAVKVISGAEGMRTQEGY